MDLIYLRMKKKIIYFLFLIILLGDLTGEALQIKWLDYTFKHCFL